MDSSTATDTEPRCPTSDTSTMNLSSWDVEANAGESFDLLAQSNQSLYNANSTFLNTSTLPIPTPVPQRQVSQPSLDASLFPAFSSGQPGADGPSFDLLASSGTSFLMDGNQTTLPGESFMDYELQMLARIPLPEPENEMEEMDELIDWTAPTPLAPPRTLQSRAASVAAYVDKFMDSTPVGNRMLGFQEEGTVKKVDSKREAALEMASLMDPTPVSSRVVPLQLGTIKRPTQSSSIPPPRPLSTPRRAPHSSISSVLSDEDGAPTPLVRNNRIVGSSVAPPSAIPQSTLKSSTSSCIVNSPASSPGKGLTRTTSTDSFHSPKKGKMLGLYGGTPRTVAKSRSATCLAATPPRAGSPFGADGHPSSPTKSIMRRPDSPSKPTRARFMCPSAGMEEGESVRRDIRVYERDEAIGWVGDEEDEESFQFEDSDMLVPQAPIFQPAPTRQGYENRFTVPLPSPLSVAPIPRSVNPSTPSLVVPSVGDTTGQTFTMSGFGHGFDDDCTNIFDEGGSFVLAGEMSDYASSPEKSPRHVGRRRMLEEDETTMGFEGLLGKMQREGGADEIQDITAPPFHLFQDPARALATKPEPRSAQPQPRTPTEIPLPASPLRSSFSASLSRPLLIPSSKTGSDKLRSVLANLQKGKMASKLVKPASSSSSSVDKVKVVEKYDDDFFGDEGEPEWMKGAKDVRGLSGENVPLPSSAVGLGLIKKGGEKEAKKPMASRRGSTVEPTVPTSRGSLRPLGSSTAVNRAPPTSKPPVVASRMARTTSRDSFTPRPTSTTSSSSSMPKNLTRPSAPVGGLSRNPSRDSLVTGGRSGAIGRTTSKDVLTASIAPSISRTVGAPPTSRSSTTRTSGVTRTTSRDSLASTAPRSMVSKPPTSRSSTATATASASTDRATRMAAPPPTLGSRFGFGAGSRTAGVAGSVAPGKKVAAVGGAGAGVNAVKVGENKPVAGGASGVVKKRASTAVEGAGSKGFLVRPQVAGSTSRGGERRI